MMRSMKVAVVAMLVSLVSLSFQVSAEETIRVFYNDANKVRFDVELPAHISVYGYNMDTLNKIKKSMTKKLRQSVNESSDPYTKKVFLKHLREMMNGDGYSSDYKQIKKGAMNIGNAVRFQIKKLPAVVFNDEFVIYGVKSLNEAISIYAKKRKNI